MKRIVLVFMVLLFVACQYPNQENARPVEVNYYRSQLIGEGASVPYRNVPYESAPVTKAVCRIEDTSKVRLSLFDASRSIECTVLDLTGERLRQWEVSHVATSTSWQSGFPAADGCVHTTATAVIIFRGSRPKYAMVTISSYADFDVEEYLQRGTAEEFNQASPSIIEFLKGMKSNVKSQVFCVEF